LEIPKRLSIGIPSILISNYFSVLAPQVTWFILTWPAQLTCTRLPAKPKAANCDVLVQKFTNVLEAIRALLSTVVAIWYYSYLWHWRYRWGLFMFLCGQTIIVMSRDIEYDQKAEVFNHYLPDMSFCQTPQHR